MSQHKHKMVWAIDPFIESQSFNKKLYQFIKAFSKKMKVAVTPVYAPVENRIGGGSANLLLNWYDKVLLNSKKVLEKELKKFKSKSIEKPVVLENTKLNTSGAVQSVVRYACEQKADFILCSTHGRKGIQRLFVGSFVENLLLNSPIPVITVGPQFKTVPAIKKILFPTDFSAESKEAFEKLLPFAKEKGAQVVLFHQAVNPWEMVPYAGSYAPMPPTQPKRLLADLKDEANEQMNIWLKSVDLLGVKVEQMVTVDTYPVDQAILKATQKSKSKMIAIASQHERVYATLLGSVTRRLVRDAKVPVWVLHPSAMEEYRVNLTRSDMESDLHLSETGQSSSNDNARIN